MKKVCHLSTVHYRYENRIFIKQCRSLAQAGYEVYYIVADGKGNEQRDNVRIIDIGRPRSRVYRILVSSRKIYQKALELDCDIYHFHDPELMFIGRKLLKRGKKVIYDIHEEVHLQIYHKRYFSGLLRPALPFVSKVYRRIEERMIKRFSYSIAANPITYDRIKQVSDKTEIVFNYPLRVEKISPWIEKQNIAVYLGVLMHARGTLEILDAALLTDIEIHIVGNFVNEQIKADALSHPGWERIVYHGALPWTEAAQIVQSAKYGLVPLHLTKFYRQAMFPSKIFEYMMLGLAVIIPEHEGWKKIIQEHNCGITIPAATGENLARAIDYLAQNDGIASRLAHNGRRAALKYFNWDREKKKLLAIYSKLLND